MFDRISYIFLTLLWGGDMFLWPVSLGIGNESHRQHIAEGQRTFSLPVVAKLLPTSHSSWKSKDSTPCFCWKVTTPGFSCLNPSLTVWPCGWHGVGWGLQGWMSTATFMSMSLFVLVTYTVVLFYSLRSKMVGKFSYYSKSFLIPFYYDYFTFMYNSPRFWMGMLWDHTHTTTNIFNHALLTITT
jgi:hypothetical protein